MLPIKYPLDNFDEYIESKFNKVGKFKKIAIITNF
tara:strand:+ start:350 stop:454 length:105 start_codon:yes stop_codon:yes gene_type:complete